MANRGSPPPPKKTVIDADALRRILGDPANMPTFADALQRGLAGAAAGDEPLESAVPSAVSSAVGSAVGSASAAAEGGLAGGGVERKKRGSRRDKHGKTLLQGGDRVVKYYKPTEAELDRLGDLSRDETTAWGRMTFCLGLLVNVILGLLFATGLSNATKGAAAALGACAALGAWRFWKDAEQKKKDGASALERVKKDHDFGTI